MGANGWIKYGWGESLSNKWSKGSFFVVDFTNENKPFQKLSAIEAALYTINQIVENYPAPYTLMCSGGHDSQAMMWAWHTSGIPFRVVSVKYISNGIWFNKHDLVVLEEFTKQYNINVTYLEFDIINFLEHELIAISQLSDCSSPHLCTYMKMVDNITAGTIIFSGDVIMKATIPSYGARLQNHAISSLSYVLTGIHRYAEEANTEKRKIISTFLMHTPELMHAAAIPLKMHVNDGRFDTKIQNYINNNFPIIKQLNKYTGFEKIKEYYDAFPNRVPPRERIKYANCPSKRVFDLLFRYPLDLDLKFRDQNLQTVNIMQKE
jgi:hypothetical protein